MSFLVGRISFTENDYLQLLFELKIIHELRSCKDTVGENNYRNREQKAKYFEFNSLQKYPEISTLLSDL